MNTKRNKKERRQLTVTSTTYYSIEQRHQRLFNELHLSALEFVCFTCSYRTIGYYYRNVSRVSTPVTKYNIFTEAKYNMCATKCPSRQYASNDEWEFKLCFVLITDISTMNTLYDTLNILKRTNGNILCPQCFPIFQFA